jgi:hypothetical protein
MDQAEINAVLYGEREPIHSDRLPWPMNALIETLIGGGAVSHLADKTGLARIGANRRGDRRSEKTIRRSTAA